MRNALLKSRERLNTNKRIAEHTGCSEAQVGTYLKKDFGWVQPDTFEKLCLLPEFNDIFTEEDDTGMKRLVTVEDQIVLEALRIMLKMLSFYLRFPQIFLSAAHFRKNLRVPQF